MEPHEYETMFRLERHHWWFQSRLRMIEGMLAQHVWPAVGDRPRLLDLGCGTGMFLQRRDACLAFGADFSSHALGFCRRVGLSRLCRADATRLPFREATFDVVTAFDLIEHVPDDRTMVDEVWRVLRPGGFFVASVPAHPLLWTGHDVSLHHMRRYRRREFEALFDERDGRGWVTVRQTSGFSTIFLPALATRLWRRMMMRGGEARSDTQPVAEWLNRLLIAAHGPETAWLRRRDLPIGISFMTIRRKHDARAPGTARRSS